LADFRFAESGRVCKQVSREVTNVDREQVGERSTRNMKARKRPVRDMLHPWSCRLRCSLYAHLPVGVAVLAFALLLPVEVASKELLIGIVSDGESGSVAFKLEGESREKVVGGRILLGGAEYTIARMSRLGLIGAHRLGGGGDTGEERHAVYLVFSSSFSAQSATGRPWVAAKSVHGCDEPYNSFVAMYRVEGEEALVALGPIPYGTLTEDISRTADSRVLCFTALPP